MIDPTFSHLRCAIVKPLEWLYLGWFWLNVKLVEWQAGSIFWNLISSFRECEHDA